MSELLNFESSTDELLWVAEALDKGLVKEGDKHPVSAIVEARNGRGFLINVFVGGQDICDFAWKKSKPGKLLAELFLDPDKAKNNRIMLTMQSSVKCAQLSSEKAEGLEWYKQVDDDINKLFPTQVRAGKSPVITNGTKEPNLAPSK